VDLTVGSDSDDDLQPVDDYNARAFKCYRPDGYDGDGLSGSQGLFRNAGGQAIFGEGVTSPINSGSFGSQPNSFCARPTNPTTPSSFGSQPTTSFGARPPLEPTNFDSRFTTNTNEGAARFSARPPFESTNFDARPKTSSSSTHGDSFGDDRPAAPPGSVAGFMASWHAGPAHTSPIQSTSEEAGLSLSQGSHGPPKTTEIAGINLSQADPKSPPPPRYDPGMTPPGSHYTA
jgi:hypothetical protein